jgi:hypothetical protein
MLTSRAARLAVALLVLDVVLFVLSGIPRYKNATHGANQIVGDIIWFGFLIGALALLITVAVWITSVTRRRRRATS